MNYSTPSSKDLIQRATDTVISDLKIKILLFGFLCHTLFYNQHLYKQRQAETDKKLGKN